jgi:hypothetical protein
MKDMTAATALSLGLHRSFACRHWCFRTAHITPAASRASCVTSDDPKSFLFGGAWVIVKGDTFTARIDIGKQVLKLYAPRRWFDREMAQLARLRAPVFLAGASLYSALRSSPDGQRWVRRLHGAEPLKLFRRIKVVAERGGFEPPIELLTL